MKTILTPIVAGLAGIILITTVARADDPRTNSWFTTYAGQYARIYTNDASKTAGKTVTTWTNGTTIQTLPAYCGVQEIYSSSNWVYIRSTGLGSFVMGPWYLNAAHTQAFPNWPVNQKTLYRFPRVPTVPTTKTASGGGPIGYFVDGAAMFNSWDAFTWSTVSNTDAQNITGYWNRDAYVNEGVSFDANNAHQAGGQYHYHANPPALRYQLGDHVDFNSATKTYSEDTNAPTKHSPILAWTSDGYPVYGPYGYSIATNANSGIRRMISGYVLRNGQNGTDNLPVTGRTTIPQWAVRLYGVSANQTGAPFTGIHTNGCYMEDNDYLGDVTNSSTGTNYQQGVDFDLDEYNGRYCVTPEFPNGTYAYFVSISSNGTPVFPYNIGRGFYGNPTGGTVTVISETVATNFLGNTNLTSTLNTPSVNNGTVTLTWSAIEGGSYQVEATTNLADSSAWTVLGAGVSPNQITGGYTNVTSLPDRFYRVGRNSVATYDSPGTTLFATNCVAPGGAAYRGQSVQLSITLPTGAGYPPTFPPANAPITSVTIGGITAISTTYATQGTVVTLFTIPSGYTPTGSQTVVVTFQNSMPTYTLTGYFTIN
jgi:hypothetical protein